ncbi:uncharacterized protein LOC113327850 [Papaver somniferum]|uniref:uncharacterized protein LOC113327850 n=1 Tax=Papaver somniferum TaxID=3469 RepID=UPI000E6F5DF9|nr:uncharacterized protein LOC113327850 [Papaver somniferum]
MESFGNIDTNIKQLHSKLDSLHQAASHQDNTSNILEVEAEIHKWEEVKKEFWQQKNKDNFFREVDNNTKLHHATANRRRSRNRIDALLDKNGAWCSDKNSLSSLFTEHFQEISTSSNPELNEDFLKHVKHVINSQDSDRLTTIPSETEIIDTLKSMDPWKAPGPDGFPPGFYLI